MRKRRPIVLIIIVGVALYWYKFHYTPTTQDDELSAIDRIIGRTQSGDTTSGSASIDLEKDAMNEQQYEGGGEYGDFSEATVLSAIGQNKRVIIIFERSGDPTSVVLRDDIIARKSRIPKDTLILFANIDNESTIVNKLQIERPNTIIYLGDRGQEIRRKGNGIVSLSQVVNGIDNLTP